MQGDLGDKRQAEDEIKHTQHVNFCCHCTRQCGKMKKYISIYIYTYHFGVALWVTIIKL